MPKCRICGVTTKTTDRCRSCAMVERWRDPVERANFTAHNQEILEANWRDPNFREMQSRLCKEKSPKLIASRTPESNERLAISVRESWERDHDHRASLNRESLQSMRGKETLGEELARKILTELGVSFESQYEVTRSSLGLRGPGRGKILDFYLPDLNLDLEIDGTSHSGMLGRESRDEERDNLLKSVGISVKRVSDTGIEEDIRNSIIFILEEVTNGN